MHIVLNCLRKTELVAMGYVGMFSKRNRKRTKMEIISTVV